MTAQELRELVRREPFQPFRLRLSDGRSYEIPHRHWTLVGESVVFIGIAPPGEPDAYIADYSVPVYLNLIEGTEPLPNPHTPAVS
jgi:hypothetical protein